MRAQEILETKFGVAADVWSVTSYKALYMDGNETERWNRLASWRKAARSVPDGMPCGCAGRSGGRFRLFEDAAEYGQQVDAAAAGFARHGWIWPQRRPASLREFFEVDSRFITLATLHELLYTDGKIEKSVVDKAIKDLGINPEK